MRGIRRGGGTSLRGGPVFEPCTWDRSWRVRRCPRLRGDLLAGGVTLEVVAGVVRAFLSCCAGFTRCSNPCLVFNVPTPGMKPYQTRPPWARNRLVNDTPSQRVSVYTGTTQLDPECKLTGPTLGRAGTFLNPCRLS